MAGIVPESFVPGVRPGDCNFPPAGVFQTTTRRGMPMNTRAAVFFAVLMFAACASHAGGKTYNKSFQITGVPDLEVESDDARVRVTGTDDSQVEVSVEYDGYDLGKSLRIEARQEGNKVHVSVRTIGRIGISLNFKSRLVVEVRMPRQGDLKVTTGDGWISVLSIKGNVSVRSADGSIKAANLAGNVDLRSADGKILAGGLQGNLRLRTSDGSIEGNNLEGDCDVTSSDGHIYLTGRFDTLNIKSGDGGIEASVEQGSRMSRSWDISSGDGSIELRLPEDFKALLNASTSDGSIKLEIPVAVEGEMKRSRVRGTLNSGGPALNIHSGDGSIRLKKL